MAQVSPQTELSAAPIKTVGDLFPDLPLTSYVGLKGPAQPVLATDAVKGVVGLDRQKFADANAAKRRVHVYRGEPGTLWATDDNCDCSSLDNLMCCGVIQIIKFGCCKPHRDMDWPDWADKALVYTEHGIVGRSKTAPDAKPHAILWGGFDIEKVEVRRYDGPRGWHNACKDRAGLDARPFHDPLTCSLRVGFMAPCCARICIQPDDAPGLYHLVVYSTHRTWRSGSGDNDPGGSYPTAMLSLIALAPGPEACLEDLRSMAAAAAVAPVALSMERGDGGSMARARGCNIM